MPAQLAQEDDENNLRPGALCYNQPWAIARGLRLRIPWVAIGPLLDKIDYCNVEPDSDTDPES